MGKLDKANADVEALERLASFLGTLFVKHDITETDEQVLQAAAKRRPKLKGTGGDGVECSNVSVSRRDVCLHLLARERSSFCSILYLVRTAPVPAASRRGQRVKLLCLSRV